MNNVGFSYGMMGLQNMDRLGELENKKIWAEYESRMKESEAKNEAIGSLVGNVAGLGMAGYSEYKKSKPMDNPPGGEQAIGKASKEAVSPNKVLGENSVIAEKAPSLSQAKSTQAQDQLGMYRPEILNSADEAYVDPDSPWAQRSIVFAKSPTRSRLISTWNDTSDGFKSAFNSLLSGFPSNFIGN